GAHRDRSLPSSPLAQVDGRSCALPLLPRVLSLVPILLAFVGVAYAAFIGWCAWRNARGPASGAEAPHGTYANGNGAVAHRTARDPLPRIAVLVAARDEEATISRCLDALLAQDYPADRIEIVVADDHSTDRTAEIVHRYAERTAPVVLAGSSETLPVSAPEASGDGAPPDTGEIQVRYVRVPDPEGDLCGKALAIHTATEKTEAPVLLVTDADCAPPRGWARALVASLTGETGLTGGLTLMEQRTAFHAAQSLDWAFLLGAASAMTEAGLPATAMGNNIAFTREAYESVGGYPGLPFSVTEDYALFKAIAEAGRWRVRFPIEPETVVRTLPARSLAHAYRQRRRWARGGMRAGPAMWGAYTLAHLAHLVPLLGLVLAPAVGAGVLAVKAGADAAHLSAVLRRSQAEPLRLGPFLLFEGFLFLYMCTLPLALLLAPRIRWKGRTH
ncbi:MAG: glycosyltransferase, partial [Bacteroidota bacterium]